MPPLAANWPTDRFEFVAPGRTIYGWGRRAELPNLLPAHTKRLFLVTGASTVERDARIQDMLAQLSETGREIIPVAQVANEPEVEDVDRGTRAITSHGPGNGDAVLAIGGGSAIDLGKALAGMATNGHADGVIAFLEGVGSGASISEATLPLVAMPTTAGTGSEATKNAVISSQRLGFKKSLRSPMLMATVALVDPELTVTCPRGVTVASGMDAITQLIESYVCVRATLLSQGLCLQGLRGTLAALRTAAREPDDRPARERMSLAALLSGMALANSGLGLAHGVAASLGIHCGVAHGLACAAMLPVAIRVNRTVAERPLAEAASVLLEREFRTPAMAIDALLAELETIYHALRIPHRLAELGVAQDQLAIIARDSYGNSMSGNPRSFSEPELTELLQTNW